MTNIKAIIASHRERMQASGLLRQAGSAQLSPQVAALRPSLTKVNRALAENPDLLRGQVQTSPMAVLFEYTLPKLEPILMEMGEEKAEQIISELCKYGQRMTSRHGVEKAKKYSGFFKDIANESSGLNIEELKLMMVLWDPECGMDGYKALREFIDWYTIDSNGKMTDVSFCHLTDSEDEERIADYLSLEGLRDLRILNLVESATIGQIISYFDKVEELYLGGCEKLCPAYLSKAFYSGQNLRALELFGTVINNDDFDDLPNMPRLEILDIGQTQITDEGLKSLQKYTNLKVLILEGNRITGKGLEHLKNLKDLKLLGLHGCEIDEEAIKNLKTAIPGLETSIREERLAEYTNNTEYFKR